MTLWREINDTHRLNRRFPVDDRESNKSQPVEKDELERIYSNLRDLRYTETEHTDLRTTVICVMNTLLELVRYMQDERTRQESAGTHREP